VRRKKGDGQEQPKVGRKKSAQKSGTTCSSTNEIIRYNPAQRRLRSSGTKDVQSERDAPLPDDGYVVFRLKTVLLSFLCVRYGPAAAGFGAGPTRSLNNLFTRIRGVIDEGCWALL
jgi:hypothetical protein